MNSACVFCIDDAYVMPFQVFFHSLEATGSIPASTSLFILHAAALSSESIEMLQAFLGRYGRVASFVDATALIPEDLPIHQGDHVSPATFYRLFIAEILPQISTRPSISTPTCSPYAALPLSLTNPSKTL